jgi:hypothetical protein
MSSAAPNEIRINLEAVGADVMQAVGLEMAVQAQMIAKTMQRHAPKFRSTLWKTIAVHQDGPLAYEIKPGVAYAGYVENGVKPGGKGLPKFNPNNDMAQWLQGQNASRFVGPHPLVRKRAPRTGSKAFLAVQKVLKDRYYGMSAHIRRYGIKAQPFVAPTMAEAAPLALARIDAAVRRVLADRGLAP